jgi:succinoglycan biosynthesis protein ExoO
LYWFCACFEVSFDLNDVAVIEQAQVAAGPQGPSSVPDVSFLIAAFNVAPFIEEAVRSALCQVAVTVEVLVIDDASKDGTADIVERLALADSRITLIKLSENVGPGAARNVGLKLARGRWIAILDGDDFIVSDRTARLLGIANATGADIVGDNFERVRFDGTPTGTFLFRQASVPFLFTVDASTFIAANEVLGSRKFSLGAIKVMIRSAFLREREILHPEDLPVGEDFRFILSCLFRKAKFVVTSTSGYKYRLRPGSQSWRLTEEHMDRLLRAHDAIAVEAHEVGAREAVATLGAYRRVLLRTSKFVKAVALAKSGHWTKALIAIAMAPETWRMAIRFGSEALLNRLKRYAPRMNRESLRCL